MPLLTPFVWLASFDRAARKLFTETQLIELETRLSERPDAGTVIAHAGGVRKLWIALAGRGRSGGARVIYYYRTAKGRLHMRYAYPKNEADNLSADGKATMASIVRRIEKEP